MELTQNYIAVEVIQNEKTEGGLVIPTTFEGDVKHGKVIHAGPGRYESGVFVETCVKPGDVVWFPSLANCYKVKSLTILRETEVFAVEKNFGKDSETA